MADQIREAPDLTVGIASGKQSRFFLVEQHAWCVHHGVQLSWLVDLDRQEVMEFTPGASPHKLPQDGILNGREVLLGFRCPVAEVFSWLREKS